MACAYSRERSCASDEPTDVFRLFTDVFDIRRRRDLLAVPCTALFLSRARSDVRPRSDADLFLARLACSPTIIRRGRFSRAAFQIARRIPAAWPGRFDVLPSFRPGGAPGV